MSTTPPTIVQHHTKYLELDGVDEIVEMTQSEHKRLHQRLRREGKCNVPPDELRKISGDAHERTQKRKDHKKAYQKTYNAEHKDERSAYDKKYYAEHRDERIAYHQKYQAEHEDECKAYNSMYRDAIKLEEAIK